MEVETAEDSRLNRKRHQKNVYCGSSKRTNLRKVAVRSKEICQELCNEIQHNYVNVTVNTHTNNHGADSNNAGISTNNNDYICSSISSISRTDDDSSVEEIENSELSANIVPVEQKLVDWMYSYNIPHNAATALLHILKPHMSGLPLDSRSLLHTPRYSVVDTHTSGLFKYFGVEKNLVKRALTGLKPCHYPLLRNIYRDYSSENMVTISVNVDGLPLFSSSNKSFWVLLGILDQAVDRCPFVVAVYYGASKPSDATEFLQPFVNECVFLERNGINITNKHYKFCVSCVIADAPARSFVKSVVGHNSLNGCEKCVQKGKYYGRTTWPYKIDCSLRSDESFKYMEYPYHQKSISVLSSLQLGLVSQVPLDYLHLICLGVMKRLIRIWCDTGLRKGKLSSKSIDTLSNRMQILRKHTPKEFSRKPRPVKLFKFWKGTEFRSFLLYFGPVVLVKVLPRSLFEHFMLLHTAVYVLASDIGEQNSWRKYANDLMHVFVKEIPALYGKEVLVYNFHDLLHLADDVANFGKLDHFSAFPFENFMKKIKNMVRAPNNPLQQVVKRLGEDASCCLKTTKQSSVVKNVDGSIRYVVFGDRNKYVIGTNYSDSCFMTVNGEVIVVNGIKKALSPGIYSLECSRFESKTDYNKYPLKSSTLKIYLVDNLVKYRKLYTTQLYRKCVLLPDFNDNACFLCIPYCNMDVFY
ncbi:uncharacterized protein LOC134527571 isoform X1 [Bacillus rossius redtenbacheri]|uniref:uncharacterized protein LOC134527571 isoform X1 n=1 Tax=Bacillus rossius redtenbacheri TaxID=93214 RepID=UPI002FDC96A5